ncbi:acyl carrier protein [Metabacillus fastidiosus]|uniref:acyl carrier protein n=1 Tax=Metabacillus fastidiosus TaxID=1458 RepID=UPI003D27C550
MNTDEKLIEIIAEVIDIDEDRLSANIGPDHIEEWDSVNALRILINIETKMGVRVPLTAYKEAKTIKELAEIIRSIG